MFKRRSTAAKPVLDKCEVTISHNDLVTPSKDDSPPPSYSARASQEQPPNISTAFANLTLNDSKSTQTPTPDQYLAHLKLLEAIYSLREDVSQQDGLFGIHDSFASSVPERRPQQLANIREKRWQIYVSKAAKRFEAWWKTSVMPNAERSTQYTVTTVTRTPWVGSALEFTRRNLPPLGE